MSANPSTAPTDITRPTDITPIDHGTITSPRGFAAGGVYIGLKTRGDGKLDLAMLASDTPCAVGGVFTTSAIRSATVDLESGTSSPRTGARADCQRRHRQYLRRPSGIQRRRRNDAAGRRRIGRRRRGCAGLQHRRHWRRTADGRSFAPAWSSWSCLMTAATNWPAP